MATSVNTLTETELIERILAGEQLLYELLVRRFNPYLYKVGRSYNYNHEDTQDLMQDTYVNAYLNLGKFEKRSSFKTWIIRIMIHNCYHKRQKMSFKNEFPHDNINENVTPVFCYTSKDTNKQMNSRELGRIIETSLEKLTEEYRIVFSLRELNGMSVMETAEILQISPSNVKVRLNRAKAQLRKEIEMSYSSTDLYEFNLVYCDALLSRVMKSIKEKTNPKKMDSGETL